jgi:endonuclease/exonuclease/phosphatase family metal-dependent hydrolase
MPHRSIVSLLLLAASVMAGCGTDAGQNGEEQFVTERWTPTAVRDGNLRIASFNIRNFPEMERDEPVQAPISFQLRTNEEALLKVLATLDFDVLGVQEIIDSELFAGVIDELSQRTGRDYRLAMSANENGNPQHVGVVVDAAKLAIARTEEHPRVDVRGTLRPGFSARLESVHEGGIDLSVMVLHLASGSSGGRATLRAEQAAEVAAVVAEQMAVDGDDDYVVLGDLNTARLDDEFPRMDAAMASGTGLERQDNPSGCSSYWIKKSTNPLLRPSWLDHVYLASLDERDEQVPVAAGAHCAERLCQAYESTDRASGSWFYDVSDHCPIYFELRDTDLD